MKKKQKKRTKAEHGEENALYRWKSMPMYTENILLWNHSYYTERIQPTAFGV